MAKKSNMTTRLIHTGKTVDEKLKNPNSIIMHMAPIKKVGNTTYVMPKKRKKD